MIYNNGSYHDKMRWSFVLFVVERCSLSSSSVKRFRCFHYLSFHFVPLLS